MQILEDFWKTLKMEEMNFTRKSLKMKKRNNSLKARLPASQRDLTNLMMPLSKSTKPERNLTELSMKLNKRLWKSLSHLKLSCMFSKRKTRNWQRKSIKSQQGKSKSTHSLNNNNHLPKLTIQSDILLSTIT